MREEEEGTDDGGVGDRAEWKEDGRVGRGDHWRGTGVPSAGRYKAVRAPMRSVLSTQQSEQVPCMACEAEDGGGVW